MLGESDKGKLDDLVKSAGKDRVIRGVINSKEEEEKAQQMIIEFAKGHTLVDAVYKGCNPENENHLTYYFLTSYPKFDEQLTDAISHLDIKVARQTGHTCSMMRWPIPPEKAGEYHFLKECLWKKESKDKP